MGFAVPTLPSPSIYTDELYRVPLPYLERFTPSEHTAIVLKIRFSWTNSNRSAPEPCKAQKAVNFEAYLLIFIMTDPSVSLGKFEQHEQDWLNLKSCLQLGWKRQNKLEWIVWYSIGWVIRWGRSFLIASWDGLYKYTSKHALVLFKTFYNAVQFWFTFSFLLLYFLQSIDCLNQRLKNHHLARYILCTGPKLNQHNSSFKVTNLEI